ncbi:hypothetical protein DFH28DRAFT_88948 [Melampsora americana]|nr:hypothetical protein DFH28DRAFT_88948 [Melampsora americana]
MSLKHFIPPKMHFRMKRNTFTQIFKRQTPTSVPGTPDAPTSPVTTTPPSHPPHSKHHRTDAERQQHQLELQRQQVAKLMAEQEVERQDLAEAQAKARTREQDRARQHAQAQAQRAQASENQQKQAQELPKEAQEAPEHQDVSQVQRQTLQQPDTSNDAATTVTPVGQSIASPTSAQEASTPESTPTPVPALAAPTEQSDPVTLTTAPFQSLSTPADLISTDAPSPSALSAVAESTSYPLKDPVKPSSGLSTGATVILVLGIVAVIFTLVILFYRYWVQKSRRKDTLTPNEKVTVGGQMKKSRSSDDDDEEMFGGHEHASMALHGFGALGIVNEKANYRSGGHEKWPRHHHAGHPSDADSISNESLQSSRYPQHGYNNIHTPVTTHAHQTRSELRESDDYSQYVSSPSFLGIPDTAALTSPATSNHSTMSPTSPTYPLMTDRVYVVKRTFEAALTDEMLIFVGDRIQVHTTYDDGWCLGTNLDIDRHQRATNQTLLSKGVFPRDCVGSIPIDMETPDIGEQPLTPGPSDLQRVPTLPPLDLGEYYTPPQQDEPQDQARSTLGASGFDNRPQSLIVPRASHPGPKIRISSPAHSPDNTPRHSDVISQFPDTPHHDSQARASLTAYRNSFGILNNTPAKRKKRISSLIAGRDAQLFMELGEALGPNA